MTQPAKAVRPGFTLIELLVVITIIAVLAVTIFAALRPAKRVQDAQDDRRRFDVNSILTAIHEYSIDNNGDLPSGLSNSMVEKQLGTAVSGCATSSGGCNVAGSTDCVNLTTALSVYLKEIPVDPEGTSSLTAYTVHVDTNGLATVRACNGNVTIYQAR